MPYCRVLLVAAHSVSVLARLESKQQALVFGHALPLPVVVRIREYGPKFYETIGGEGDSEAEKKRKVEELFGD